MSFILTTMLLAALADAPQSATAGADAAAPTEQPAQVELTAEQLFALADRARDVGDYAVARQAYGALASNPDPDLRNEARFRLALMLADKMNQPREAATTLREILDDKPDASRVRVELARILVMMGEYGRAEAELRAAQAGGLPAEVDQMVRFYAGALRARRPFGGSLSLSIAPDSNINRATRSDTLGTVIGDFELSDDAKAQSGVGLDLMGQTFARIPVDANATVLVQANGAGRFYRKSEFNDYAAGLQVGPQYEWGSDRLNVAGLANWRWFGGDFYAFTYGVSSNFQHPLGRRSRMTLDGSITYTNDALADTRDANRYSLAVAFDRAFSPRSGGGLQLAGSRAVARDPGFSTANGGISGYAFREFGPTTVVARLGYDHLEADKRLFLYPRRRVDDRASASLTGTFRSLKIGSLAPLVKVGYEKNWSTVELYEYRRAFAEAGITAAF